MFLFIPDLYCHAFLYTNFSLIWFFKDKKVFYYSGCVKTSNYRADCDNIVLYFSLIIETFF
ncbi:hypothetical protein D1164_18955 [Mariniphaga sediminis]|uniref:Uncharacterized protein n=1 Tax=Mariniphaga sediminis TaxID=1628158 RepID=A0A399CVQ0_9BACT|nr:hypothetical protein D1164_18955 [Mariniphaga sediminis]